MVPLALLVASLSYLGPQTVDRSGTPAVAAVEIERDLVSATARTAEAAPATAAWSETGRDANEDRQFESIGLTDRDFGIESVLAGAWRNHGCAVNPGNPACLTIGLAAECARNAQTPGCSDDRDGDRCTDVAEVLSGFDPFDGGDCLSNRGGAPAINCLVPSGNLPCNEVPGLDQREPVPPDCPISVDVERALHPRNPYACGTAAATPEPDRAFFDRDPTCDGFARRLY